MIGFFVIFGLFITILLIINHHLKKKEKQQIPKGMKKCPYCKSIIDKNARICPNCRKEVGFFAGCSTLLGIIVIPAIIFFVISFSQSSKGDITLSEYNQIQAGMTYEEVKNIVGVDGEIAVQSETEGYSLVAVTWYGDYSTGASACIMFENGLVTTKSQAGLRN